MKYTKINNTYIGIPKDDPQDRLQVEVGDSKQPEFYPQVKIMRWDNEVNASFRLTSDLTNASFAKDGEKVNWEQGETEAHFYNLPIDEKHPEGGYEFEVVLKSKPKTNRVEMSLQTKGLEFFYQPALTQEEIDQGASRPENVVGSYAVYYKDCPANYVDGKLYRVGKAFHIFRPRIEDAVGNWTWGELNIDEARGTLTVTIPQKFLDEAVYPVRHAAGLTFGYTGQGAAGTYGTQDIYRAAKATGAAGTANSISAYIRADFYQAGTSNVKFALYKVSDGTIIGYTTEASYTGETFDGKQTLNFVVEPTISAIDYWICSWGNDVMGPVAMYYDTVEDEGSATSHNYSESWTSPATFITYDDKRYSIYCTYTAGGGTNATVNASAQSSSFSQPAASVTVIRNKTVSAGVQTATLSQPTATVTAVAPILSIYNNLKKNIANGLIDLDTNTLKVMLVTSDYSFDQDAHEFADDITNEITGTGYSAGGAELTGGAVTADTDNDKAVFDANDLTWNGASFTFRGAVLYKDTGEATTSPLICFLDFKADQSASSENLTLQWGEGGILTLT